MTSLEGGERRAAPRRAEDRRFRAIVEFAAVGIAAAGLDARILDTNPMLQEMLGYAAGELEGMAIRDFTHPDDVDRNLELFHDLVAGTRERYQLEKRYVRKDGTVFWGRVNTSLVRDPAGAPELVVATIEDVDARRHAEAQLAEAETRYRTLVEQLPLVTYIDANDDISSNIYTSPQLETLLGYTPREWREDRELFVKLLHPDDRERVLREVAEATAAGNGFASEYRLVARDGRVVWFRDQSVPIRDASGAVAYNQGYLLDITERKVAEEAMRESEERFRSMADEAPVLVWTTDDQGRVTFISRGWLELTGRTPAQELGFGWLESVHPDDAERALDSYLAAVREREPWEALYRLRRHDGSFRWIEDRGRPRFLSSGTMAGYVGIGIDITERKQAEDALARRDAVLEAVAGLAEQLLRAPTWQDVDLGGLGEAAGVSRVYVFERRPGTGGAVISQRCEWAAAGVVPLIDDPALAEFDLAAKGFGDLIEPLARGAVVQAHASALRGAARAELARQGSASILLVPIVVDGDWWGLVGVAECATERVWTEGEIEALRAAAGILGETIGRERAARSLREATDALRESEARFAAFMTNTQALAWMKDEDGRYVYANERWEHETGLAVAELVGRTDHELFPGGAQSYREADERVRRTGRPSEQLARLITAEGEERTFLALRFPFEDPSGRRFVGGVALDITERERAEAALAESEERFRTLVANVPGAIYRCAPDSSWTMSFLSDAVEEITGYPPADFVGNAVRSYASVIHEDDRAGVEQAVHDALGCGQPFTHEYRVVHADGSVRWVAENGRPVFGRDGALLWLDGVLFDITAQRRALDDRARTQALLDSVVEHIPTALFVKDAAELRFVRLNRAAEELFGYRREDFLDKSDWDFFPPEQAGFFAAKDREVLEGRRLVDIPEEPIEVRGGGTRYLHTRKVPILGEDGEPIYLIGISEDITERRLAEEEREKLVSALAAQNEQLLELDRMKDEFVALVSHELRTPLTSILGYLELVADDERGSLTDEQRHFLSVVERNSRRLLRLVGDLLFVAQMEAGKLVIDREEVDLAAVASDCVEAARPRAAEKGIALSLDRGERADLEGDRTRIAQLLDNLISNAIKFTGEGGRVEVRVERRNGTRVVTVSDTGMGLGPDEVARLFERFYRSAAATAGAIQGTGLGLTITKAIAEAHGGSIAVQSERGVGTTFTVELPTGQEARPGPAS